MRIYVLFQHYNDDPTLMPNAIAVMDEFTMDEVGYSEWKEECEKAKERYGPGSYREAIIRIPDNKVTDLFKTATLEGELDG